MCPQHKDFPPTHTKKGHFFRSQHKVWSCFFWKWSSKTLKKKKNLSGEALQWVFTGSNIVWAAQREKKRKEHKRQRREPFSSFERSDIWNKELSYVNRQTDRGQILPARQVNRPRRVGSLPDDSFMHRKIETHTHTHTHTQADTVFNLKTLLQWGKYVPPFNTEWRCFMEMPKETEVLFAHSHVSTSSCLCLRRRWKFSRWDCLSRRLSQVTDSECVGSLCFPSLFRHAAKPNKTFNSLPLEPSFVRLHFIWFLERAASIFQHPFIHGKSRRPDKRA